MTLRAHVAAISIALSLPFLVSSAAFAQKQGGVLKVHQRDSPASASIHEEATISTNLPFMPVFNNLVIYKDDVPQNSMESIVPELATSWAWDATKTKLTFKLREGVKWHDGKPFTAKDAQCTMDMLTGKAKDALRKNPRASWYSNVESVSVNGDLEATLNLKRPQPSILALLASGYSPMYPCHVSTRDMRVKPVGTGPFKFVEFKANEYIKLTRNPDYWRKDRPLLDGIEFTVITNRSTAILAFVAGKFDFLFPYDLPPQMIKDVKGQAPQAMCQVTPTNVSTNLIVNPQAAPFDNPEIRRAMALTLDRKAFIDILSEGQHEVGGAMLSPPSGVWGLPKDRLMTLPGYDPDVKKNRDQARAIMQKLGYGPDKKLSVKIATRNIAVYRDPAVILIDQLKEIFIEGELEVIETANWHAKIARKDYQVGLNLTGSGVDDPDQQFYENYMCGSERNVTGYCNKDLDKLFDQQSAETDPEKRRKLVWDIDQKLQEDGARPIVFHGKATTCWHPQMKGLTLMVNSIYNGWRFENIWLDK